MHHPRLAGLEADGGAGCDIQPKSASPLAIEAERVVRFIGIIVRADLDRPVAGVRDLERPGRPADIELNVARTRDYLTGDHAASLPDRVVDGDELRAVGERRLD